MAERGGIRTMFVGDACGCARRESASAYTSSRRTCCFPRVQYNLPEIFADGEWTMLSFRAVFTSHGGELRLGRETVGLRLSSVREFPAAAL